MSVSVLNQRQEPLMPCSPRKASILRGEKVNKGSVNCNKLKLIGFRKNMLWERRMAIPPLP